MKTKKLLTLLCMVVTTIAFAHGPRHWGGAMRGPVGWRGGPARGSLYHCAPNHHPGWRDCYRPVYSHSYYGRGYYGYRGYAVPPPVVPAIVPAVTTYPTVYPYTAYPATTVVAPATTVVSPPVVTAPVAYPPPAVGVGVRVGPIAVGVGRYW